MQQLFLMWFVFLYFYPSVRPFTRPPVHPFENPVRHFLPSVLSSVLPSVRLFVRPSTCLSVRACVRESVRIRPSVYTMHYSCLQAINPSFTMNAVGSTQAILQVPSTIEYNLTIPNNTETFYSLHVEVPANYKLCGIVLMYQGVNIPCMDPLMQVFVDFDLDGFYDRADWNLGKIKNTGQRPYYIDPQANVAQFYIYVVPLLSATAGSVTATMTYTSGGNPIQNTKTVALTIGSSTIANSVTVSRIC